MKTKILVALHKPYSLPGDSLYVPLRMGAAGKPPLFRRGNEVVAEAGPATPIEGDDGGENISVKNTGYSELTGLYYAWKNWTDCDAVGLVHYRRYFGRPFPNAGGAPAGSGPFSRVLTTADAEKLLERADILVPVKRYYVIESLFTHYANTHDSRHLIEARSIVADRFPDYIPAVDEAYSNRWGYMFNMAVMKRSALESYCSFLFPVLAELEGRLSGTDAAYEGDPFAARLYGRVSEILFNAWLLKHKEYRVVELPLVNIERVNWIKKGTAFLSAHFFRKKYKKSF